MANWDKRFMDLAKHIALWSKDRSTKLGAVIVDDNHRILSVGYNGFPQGCDDSKESRHERPAKYLYTEHAERNAIYNAGRNGVKLQGATIYVPIPSCVDCTRAIIQTGIKKVVFGLPDPEEQKRLWQTFNFDVSLELFREVDVKVQWYNENEIKDDIKESFSHNVPDVCCDGHIRNK